MYKAGQVLGIAHHGDRQDIRAPQHHRHETQFGDVRQRLGHTAGASAALHLNPDIGQQRSAEAIDIGHRRQANLPLVFHALDAGPHGALGHPQLGGDQAIADPGIARQQRDDALVHRIQGAPTHRGRLPRRRLARPQGLKFVKGHPVGLVFQYAQRQRRCQAPHPRHGRQALAHQLVQRRLVLADHQHLDILRAHHHIHREHLRQARQVAGHRLRRPALHLHPDGQQHAVPRRLDIGDRHHPHGAGLLQAPHPGPHRALGDTQFPGDGPVGHAAICAQQGDDALVGGIQR